MAGWDCGMSACCTAGTICSLVQSVDGDENVLWLNLLKPVICHFEYCTDFDDKCFKSTVMCDVIVGHSTPGIMSF